MGWPWITTSSPRREPWKVQYGMYLQLPIPPLYIVILLWVPMQRGLGNHWSRRSFLRHPRLMTRSSQTLHVTPPMVILVDLSALANLWSAISVGLCLKILKSIPCGLFITFKSGEWITILVILNNHVPEVHYWQIIWAGCLLVTEICATVGTRKKTSQQYSPKTVHLILCRISATQKEKTKHFQLIWM